MKTKLGKGQGRFYVFLLVLIRIDGNRGSGRTENRPLSYTIYLHEVQHRHTWACICVVDTNTKRSTSKKGSASLWSRWQGNYALLRDIHALRLASKLADLRAGYANLQYPTKAKRCRLRSSRKDKNNAEPKTNWIQRQAVSPVRERTGWKLRNFFTP